MQNNKLMIRRYKKLKKIKNNNIKRQNNNKESIDNNIK